MFRLSTLRSIVSAPSAAGALAVGLLTVSCGVLGSKMPSAPADAFEIGASEGVWAQVVADGLMNPSGVSFDKSGKLYVCDSGNGQVVVIDDAGTTPYITGFKTEYWKVDAKTGAKRFKLGPLSAVWMDDGTLVVSDGGHKDGADRLGFFKGPGTANDGRYTSGISPTTRGEKDNGEGNPIGLAVARDTIYAAGQGADAKSWVLQGSSSKLSFEPLLSADANGIATNSPMQVLVESDDTLLVLYSGAGGKPDGLLVRWSLSTGTPIAQFKLPGLVDPMGMAFYPGSKTRLAIVDNNWALRTVNNGGLYQVDLPKSNDGEVVVTQKATALRGPVSCAFGPDRRLYIAQLGIQFDAGKGQVLAVSGLR